MPKARGSSGPTTVRPISSFLAHLINRSKSLGSIGALTPSRAVPALPGAQNTWATRGDCPSFHARACSRPPLPITNTFMGSFSHPDGIRDHSAGQQGVNAVLNIYVDVSRLLETQVDRMLSQSRRRQHRPIIKNQDRAGVGKRTGRHDQTLLTAGTVFPPANELQRRA